MVNRSDDYDAPISQSEFVDDQTPRMSLDKFEALWRSLQTEGNLVCEYESLLGRDENGGFILLLRDDHSGAAGHYYVRLHQRDLGDVDDGVAEV